MGTLLLRFAAPLQAWGSDSKFEIRKTEMEPTKSGVIGLLAAALGRKRNENIDDLDKIHFGVRIDQPGEVICDYHTVKGKKDAYVTKRYYLADAVFLVGIESEDEEMIRQIGEALGSPAFPLFLGRRSCPPTMPLVLGTRNKDLYRALLEEEWLIPEWRRKDSDATLPIITDLMAGEEGKVLRQDVPLSFDPKHRVYGWRKVRERDSASRHSAVISTEHDPIKELD